MANIPIQNAPTTSKPVDFMAVAGRYGSVAKANKFITRINPGNLTILFEGAISIFRDLEFLCETSELPGRNLITQDYRYYGPTQKFPYQTQYNELNLTFLCRTEMHEKDLFDSWLQYINPLAHYNFRYKDEYSVTIEVFQFSEQALNNSKNPKPTYQVYFEKAYPISVNPLSLNWADDGLQRLQVSFAYDRWYRAGEIPGAIIPGTDTGTFGGLINF